MPADDREDREALQNVEHAGRTALSRDAAAARCDAS